MNKPEVYERVVTVGVDIQNDFCPGGSLAVPEGDLVVPVFNTVAEWTRSDPAGLVAFTRDWHPAHTNHFIPEGGPWPVHCVADTEGAAFKEGLDVRNGDTVLSKGTHVDEDAYSGFQAKSPNELTLETLMAPVSHERIAVIIGGLATDYCVKATVMDALKLAERAKTQNFERKLGVFVLEDAIKAVDVAAGDGERAIAEMRVAGAQFVTVEDIVYGSVIEVRN